MTAETCNDKGKDKTDSSAALRNDNKGTEESKGNDRLVE